MKIDWMIIRRRALGKLTDREREELDAWEKAGKENRAFLSDAEVWYREEPDMEFPSCEEMCRAWRVIDPQRRGQRLWIKRICTVAAVAVVVVVAFWGRVRVETVGTVASVVADNAVRLILADGREYELNAEATDSLPAGFAAGTLDVRQLEVGPRAVREEAQTVRCHEIIVPRYGEYRLVLADGTRVFLNAVSTLRFPETFGEERKVALTGEAYFEVVRDTLRPFIVELNGTQVLVSGTQFNVKARPGEASFTTLVDGVVKVVRGRQMLTLKPGEQCEAGSEGMSLNEPDLMAVLAWKNGEFVFRDVPLGDIMDELSAWYDMQVAYETEGLKDIRFHLYVERSRTLEEVLRKITLTGRIGYAIDGKKVIISTDKS